MQRKTFIAILFLFALCLLAACQPAAPVAVTPSATPPAPTETPIPTPTPIEVAPGEFLPPSQVIGYEARDTSGELIYVQDAHGNWIKASHEVKIADATETDWASVNERLGSDFVVSTDGTITGVDGLNIDKENGEVIFNFDGKGTETYHIGNIKVQEVNGEQRLLVAGYSWNAGTKAWEVFNPGFPMDDPRTELGWFSEADVPNGNWLRFHQRALQDKAIKEGFENIDGSADIEKYMKHVFEGALGPTEWKFIEKNTNIKRPGFPNYSPGIHYGSLWWENPTLQEAWNKAEAAGNAIKGEAEFIKREQFPIRSGLSNTYNYDLDAANISMDLLNGGGSTTSLPTIIDRERIWENKKDRSGFAMLAEACGKDLMEIEEITGLKKNAKQDKEYMIWPLLSSYPDHTNQTLISLSDKNKWVLEDQAGIDRRTKTIDGTRIKQSASLEEWAILIHYAGSIQYWEWDDND